VTTGPYASFRPLRTRQVAYPVGIAWMLLMAGLAFFLPVSMGPADRAGFLLLGVGAVWFLHRQASVVAVPSEGGLFVRNLFLSRDLEWAEIVAVRFGGGDPWVTLDLSDGDTLAVMAVQRADGERAVAESRRLATLVARHTATPGDD
jgi:hypothetical protein